MTKLRQWVVNDEQSVPDGFRPLNFFGRPRTRSASGHRNYEILHKAYAAGDIAAVKVMKSPRDKHGRVFVNAQEAEAILAKQVGERPQLQKEIGVNNYEQSLERMCVAMERIADCLESLATAPKGGV